MKLELGQWSGGGRAVLNLERLIETRMLIQANSGGGKSWAMRRLLEITHGHIQQLIIDVEGEFSSLREKHDLVIVSAHGGDALASVKTARLLATRLLETQASAVLDLYDLKLDHRHTFVRLFFESLIEAPKHLRHPVLTVLDEAHLFCPEKGQGESEATDAVIDMASRGRKRGLCLVAATQRIGKFNKSAAAEMKNRMIGSTGIDIDVKRAAFELGMQPKEALQILRSLTAGHFHAFGPAFGQVDPRELIVGDVHTTHPKVGHKQHTAPPKPTDAIKALLPKLADLPREAEEEARTADELRKEVVRLKRELKTAGRDVKAQSQPAVKDAAAIQAAFDKGQKTALKAVAVTLKRLRGAIEELMKFVVKVNASGFSKDAGVEPEALQKAITAAVDQAMRLVDSKLAGRAQTLQKLQSDGGKLIASVQKLLAENSIDIDVEVKHNEPFTVAPTRAAAPVQRPAARERSVPTDASLTPALQNVLDSLAWLEAKGVYPAPKPTLAAKAGVSPTSGSYYNNLGKLRSSGLLDYQASDVVFTDEGRAAANLVQDDGRDVHEHWYAVVVPAQRKVLECLVASYPDPLAKDELATRIGVSPTSGSYYNNLGRLRTLGAIDYNGDRQVFLTKHVMPE